MCLLAGCAALGSRGTFVACQAADTATTLHATSLGAEELNPIVAAVLSALGPGGFIAAKAGATVVLLHYYGEVSSTFFAVASGVTCAVAVNNARIARNLSAERE